LIWNIISRSFIARAGMQHKAEGKQAVEDGTAKFHSSFPLVWNLQNIPVTTHPSP